MNAIELKNVSKIYRKGFRALKVPAVVDLSFSVKEKRVTGFIGPNGAGKTTSIKMIMGLASPSLGSVSIFGRDSQLPQARTGVAYLSEQPYFYVHLTVYETLQFAANLMGLPRDKVKLEIERVLTVVELTGKINVKVKELSKGMQQRLSMAQALLGDPQLYILDEPMSGMDPPGRRLFRDLFCQLSKRGKTIFFSTHVLDDVETVCDDVIVLSKGELTFSGRIVDLLERGVLGTEMVISGLVTDDFPFLKNLGCTITESNNNTAQLFLSSNCDMASIQSYLCSKNVIFNAVNKRSMSLEQLLYQKSKVESL